MSERAGILLDALEKQADASLAQLEATRARLRALEAENLALRKELESLSAQMRLGTAEPVPPALAEQAETALEPDRRPESSGVATQPAPESADVASMSPSGPALQSDASPHDAPTPQALLAQWYRRYPKTFFKGHTRPLKTGIHLELAECEPWSEKLVRRALACYVHLPRYLKAVRAGAARVGLNGEEAGIVNEDEALHARKQLESLQQQQQERDRKKSEQRLDRKLGELLSRHGH
ncbi:ProQ/FINO family protein [Halomonas sp. WWR20]